jgi:hydrocephalus-inducing protein
MINIVENHKPFYLSVRGNGAQVNLDFNTLNVNIGPVLPYDKFAHAVLEISNPNPYPTELYSLDFDKSYLAEEEILA